MRMCSTGKLVPASIHILAVNNKMPDHAEVFCLSKQHITVVLETNMVPHDAFSFVEVNHAEYNYLITYSYSFSAQRSVNTVAGGKGISGHHYNVAAYQETKDNYMGYAENPVDEKRSFINKVNSNVVGYFREDSNHIVWVAPKISYSYNCKRCLGSGKVDCYSCHGTGKTSCYYCYGAGYVYNNKTEYFGNGQARTVRVREACRWCSTTGKVNCSACGGARKQTCSSCSGYGFFTEYCAIKTVAQPATNHGAENGLHSAAVVRYFSRHNNTYVCNIMLLANTGGQWLSNGQFRFNMSAPICVVEERIIVLEKSFTEIAVNRVPGILSPPIFDHVLSAPKQRLSDALSQRRGKRRDIITAYYDIKGHHAVHHALLAYAEAGDADNSAKVAAVQRRIRDCTGGYVSVDFSRDMADGVVNVMTRLAPHGTAWPWWLVGGWAVGLEIIMTTCLGYNGFDYAINRNIYAPLFAPLLTVESWFIVVMALPTAAINWGVTRYQQRGVPEIHRPRVFHRKPLMRVVKSIGVVWLVFMALLLLLHRYAVHAYFMAHQYGEAVYFRLSSAFKWSGVLAFLHFFRHFST